MADEIARRRLRKFKPVEVRKDAPFGEDVARAALSNLQSRSFPNRKVLRRPVSMARPPSCSAAR